MRPGQGPLMPTLAPPLGLGLAPAHPALLQPPHNLGHGGLLHPPQPDGSCAVRPQSVPPAPSPHAATSPSSKSTFAAALRDLAKNSAADPGAAEQLQRRGGSTPVPSSGGVTSSLLDVRKGFGRTTPSGSARSTPTPGRPGSCSSASHEPGAVPGAGAGPGAGFQPYPGTRPPLDPRLPALPGPGPGYHPALFPGAAHGPLAGIPSPFGPEADQAALYQAHMARYAAALGVSPAPFPAHLLPGGPAHHAAYPPELLQAYGLASAAHFPPTSAAAVEIARLHEKIRADEARRLEAESRREADRRASEQLRARERERAASPAAGRRSGDALLKLSKIADRSQPQAGPRLQARTEAAPKPSLLARTIKLPTAPLDFSELSPARPRSPGPASPSSVRSASPTPVSPSPPPSPGQAEAGASRCRPYVPRPRTRPSEPSSVSTPRKLFVRPFEDDYSPIQPPSGLGSAEEPLDISASSLSPNKEGKQNGSTNVDLDDIVKPDDQDSDYESMSSDSSVKKEGSLLCPNSGHLLPDEECGVPPAAAAAQLQKLGVFREPEADSASRKDKLNYLRYFRLVTHRRKNDIEIEKLERRRARLRERSPSPEAAAEERAVSPELPLPSVAPHLNRLPETHAKAMYLSAIGLCRNSEEQKISNEVMWAMILEDRLTREPAEQRSLITKYFVKLRDLPALPDTAPAPALSPEPGARGVKRAYDGSLVADPAPAPAVSPRYSGLNIPSSDAVSRLAGEGGGLGEAGPVVSLPASLEINLCSLQPIAKPTLLLQDTAAVKAEPGGGPAPAPPAHLQPHLSFPRVLSSPFKAEVKTEPEDLSVSKRTKRTSSPYAWPGVEAILESYKKFTSDCEQEKAALLERGARAQAEVSARRGQVDTMSTRLSSLARLHKTLVGNHGHAAASLDTLRSQLAAISKLVGAKT